MANRSKQYETPYYELFRLRKWLLQMDREKTRKKTIRALKRLLVETDYSMHGVIWTSLSFAYCYEKRYDYALFYCKKTIDHFSLQPEAIFCATLMVHLYRVLGMKKERFEAEGSRFHLMKKIAMHSENQEHRLIALKELRQEFEDRDLLAHFYSFYDQTLRNQSTRPLYLLEKADS